MSGDKPKKKITPAKPRRERAYPQAMRVFSYNFLDNLLAHIKIEGQKCVVPLADVNKLVKKYFQLYGRYKRETARLKHALSSSHRMGETPRFKYGDE